MFNIVGFPYIIVQEKEPPWEGSLEQFKETNKAHDAKDVKGTFQTQVVPKGKETITQ
jgi:hypothetical protein